MTRLLRGRLAKLETRRGTELSESVKAWLGMRPPLTAEEQAAEDERERLEVRSTSWSPELRDWLGG